MRRYTVSVDLPKPAPCLWQNASRFHWAIRRARAKQSCSVEAQAFGQRPSAPWPSATALVTYFHASPQHPDSDNLIAALKGAADGLQRVGVVANDKRLLWLPVRFELVHRGDPRRMTVRIQVRPGIVDASSEWDRLLNPSSIPT